MISKIEEARLLAYKAHAHQSYDFWPYEKHLRDVEEILKANGFSESYIIAGICHDLLEDSHLSFNDLKTVFGKYIAEIVYACTDELGHNRKERKQKVYQKLQQNPAAIPVKLADRLANMRHSERMKSSQFEMYIKEYPEFREALHPHSKEDADSLWN